MTDPFAITKELVRKLADLQSEGSLRFLLIGGYGLEAHSIVRDTRDIDFLVATESLPLVERVLFDLAYEREDLTDLCGNYKHPFKNVIPVDLLLVNTSTMDKLWNDRKAYALAGQTVYAPSVPSYIALKLHAIKSNPKRFGKDASDIVRLVQENFEALRMDELRTLCDRFGPPGVFQKFEILLS
jgi:predicted nucleotidyltransferase